MDEEEVYPDLEAHTKLINISRTPVEEMDVYVGEEAESYDLEDSLFLNPFDEPDLGRKTAVEYFKLYMYRRYIEDKEYREALHSISGKNIGCLCYPEVCHGEVIVDFLNKYHQEGIESTIQYMREEVNDIKTDDMDAQGFKEYQATMDALDSIENKNQLT